MALLEIRDLRKGYPTPEGELPVVAINEFQLDAQEQVALAGSSGSGKTTLLHMIAGILRPDSGSIVFDGTEVTGLSEAKRDRFRAEQIGYVFQSFHLLDGYSALENVLMGMMFGAGPDTRRARALLEELGLGDRLQHRPPQLSLGQQQRVALARALAAKPRLVLADEPTGSLDATHAQKALELLRRLCTEQSAALLLVSHDPAVLGAFDRVVDLSEINQAQQVRAASDTAEEES